MAKKILILGAGYAGIEAALTLNKKGKKEDLEITLIDKNPYHTLLTELHEVAGNRVSEEAVRIPLREIFKYTAVNLVMDEIVAFDYASQTLRSKNKDYTYDYLILAIGGAPNFYSIPGIREFAYTLWSFDDAIRLREQIRNCFVLASQEKDETIRRRLLTFVLGGAGFTGVELIGEIAHWQKSLVKEYGVDSKEVRLVLIDVLPRVMANLSQKNSEKSEAYLSKKLKVELMMNTAIKEATENGVVTANGTIETATFMWAAGIRSSLDVDNMSLETVGGQRRLKVDEFARTQYQNVYAIGDVGALAGDDGKPYPAMVENAIQSAHGAAMNLLADIRKTAPTPVKVKMHGIMVCIGNYFAVSDIMGKMLPVWLSIVMKYLVNIHYLWEITGFKGVARYLQHEVMERKQRKILLEKHWSTRMQAWWATPLRMFFGVMWLVEGLIKVGDGWLSSPKLASFLGMSSDATSGATGAGIFVTRTDDLVNIKTGLVNFLLGQQTRLVEGNAVSEALFAKVEVFHFGDFNMVPWFLQNVVLASDGMAMFFQVLVVILEIGVGLMLLGGAFTFIASIISLGLMTMFLTSTGLYEKSWWMFFASFATMGGAGRAFGLDYYLIPYLANVWDSFWKNRKLRLFFKKSLDR